MKKLLLTIALVGTAAVAAAQDSGAPFTIQESGQGFGSLQQAIDAVGDSQATILIAPGTYRQCGIQQAGRISFVAAEPGTAVFDGVACEGKAALVLGGRSATVNGLTFQNITVADGNGAGIRLQQGDLVVTETMFRDSQSGILSHDDPSGTIRIERSTFSGLGYCGSDCAHSIYIGNYGRLIVSHDRFERGTGGHYVKTRGARVDVTQSSFDDSDGHATNYMIDLSNGGVGTIAGNTFVQGADKENYSAMIVVSAEGEKHKSGGLAITGNDARLAPGAKPTTFVVNYTGEPIGIEGNRLPGKITRLEDR